MRALSVQEIEWVVGGQEVPPPTKEQMDALKKQMQEMQERQERFERQEQARQREERCQAIVVGGASLLGAGIGGGIAVAGTPATGGGSLLVVGQATIAGALMGSGLGGLVSGLVCSQN